ncbi:MAG TPA: hypothetical protein VD971_11915 [Phycisphaerales bacterium]|nr:hypothetical protein [Phycisphaerales bacterium]
MASYREFPYQATPQQPRGVDHAIDYSGQQIAQGIASLLAQAAGAAQNILSAAANQHEQQTRYAQAQAKLALVSDEAKKRLGLEVAQAQTQTASREASVVNEQIQMAQDELKQLVEKEKDGIYGLVNTTPTDQLLSMVESGSSGIVDPENLARFERAVGEKAAMDDIGLRNQYAEPAPPPDLRGAPILGEVGEQWRPPEATSMGDAFRASWIMTGQVLLRAKRRLTKHAIDDPDSIFAGAMPLEAPTSRFGKAVSKPFDVDEFVQQNEDVLSPAVRAAYINGDFDDIDSLDDFINYAAYFAAEDAYRNDLRNARGFSGFLATTAGGLLAPESLLASAAGT